MTIRLLPAAGGHSLSLRSLESIQQMAGVCLWLLIAPTALAADAAEAIRKAAQAEIDTADTAAMFKKADLSQKYLAALTNLEKTLAAGGQLDAIVHVREEREAMQKSGETTAHTDKPLVELCAKYQKSVDAIDAEMNSARAKVVSGIAPKIREQETVLTKAGKVDDALALRKEGERMPMYGDLGSMFFFTNCAFDKCRFKKGGTWRGWDQASNYYFENCYFKGSFSDPINVVHNGFRVQTSVFESMDLPPMYFISKQPADYVNRGWLRLINCRFVKCKIPVSFLLLTRDCVFQNCTLTNDPDRPDDEAEITKPFEIVAYGDLSVPLGVKMPGKVKLTHKPATELKGVTIPTAASLAEMMAR